MNASKTIAPIPGNSDSMQQTCSGLSKIFSSLATDFEIIANMAGLQLDLTTVKGKTILEKINTIPNLSKPQLKKCMKEISVLLSDNN